MKGEAIFELHRREAEAAEKRNKPQPKGGFVQGLGGALYEEFRYDERSEPLCVTLADYLLPTVRETPSVEVLVTRGRAEPAQPAWHKERR